MTDTKRHTKILKINNIKTTASEAKNYKGRFRKMEAMTNKNYDLVNVAKRDDAIKIFFDSIDIKPTTARAYKKSIKYFFNYLDNNGITDIKQSDIINYKNYLVEHNEAPSINLYLTALKRLYKFLNSHYGIKDLTLELKGIKTNREHKKDGLTIEQMRQLLNIEMTKRDKAIMILLYTGALREIEIIRANIEDLTIKGGQYILRVQGKGRDKKDNYINITATTYKAINEYLATRKNPKPSDPLFTSEGNRNNNGRLSTSTIRHFVKSKLREIGINTPRISTHSIRHTAITHIILNNNKNIFEAQKFARHSNPNTTQIYIDELADNEAKNKGADILENLIKGQ